MSSFEELDAAVAAKGGAKAVHERALAKLPPDDELPPVEAYEQQPPDATATTAAQPFTVVPLGDLASWEPQHPGWWWDGLMPAGEVTGISGHGGTGKSTLAASLCAHIAQGLPYLGRPTRRGRVLFFSAEDPASVLRFRLAKIVREFDLDCSAMAERLHVVDATDGQPVLWADARSSGSGRAGLTGTYRALKRYIHEHQIDVLLVDNASDVFAGEEINRAAVRAFMQALAGLVRPRGGAVLLLMHVDKASARGLGAGSDNYSGSTAWHNSARSRLFLKRAGDGLELVHEKCNHGPLLPPVALTWPEGSLPKMAYEPQPIVAAIQARNDLRALLRLIQEFSARGEFVSTATTGPGNCRATLTSDRKCPQLKAAEFVMLLRDAERLGYLRRESYRNAARKDKERFALTAAGLDHIGAAPVAPVAPVPDNQSNPSNPSNGAAPVAPVAHRGYGGNSGAENRSETL